MQDRHPRVVQDRRMQKNGRGTDARRRGTDAGQTQGDAVQTRSRRKVARDRREATRDRREVARSIDADRRKSVQSGYDFDECSHTI